MKSKNKFILGDEVKVLEGCGFTLEKGDVGIITEFSKIFEGLYRVTVKGKDNFGNLIDEKNIELIKIFKLPNVRKKQLLEDLDVFEVSTFTQLLKLIWWDMFNHKKCNTFFNYLDKGMSVQVAFFHTSK